ncbi:MAG: methionyl-tRNA formyltransferase [Thermomicrobiales bacterium]
METDRVEAAAESWRIVVFTTVPNGFVLKLVDDVAGRLGHRVVAVVTTPGPERRRSADYLSVVESTPPNVDVLVSNHPSRWADIVAVWKPDLIVSGGFAWLIPEAVTSIPRLGAFNIHPALLPRNRGPAPIEWALRNGDTEMGFTAHRISNAFDTGALLAQIREPIEDDDTAGSLLDKLESRLPELVGRAISRIAQGDAGEPQDEGRATYAGLFEPEWREIDWQQPARTIHNQVRSWIGFRDTPRGAFGVIDGDRMLITQTRLPKEGAAPLASPPGTVLDRTEDDVIVQCGDGPLTILEWSRTDP